MKNKGIIIFLILLGILIVAIIVGDFVSDRPDKREANPFEYNVDEFKEVDPELILYRETKNFNIGFEKPAGIAVHDDRIYITGDRSIKIINRTGQLLLNIDLNAQPTAVDASGNKVFVAVDNQIVVYDKQGNMLKEWEHPGENSILTSIAIADSIVFVADAGNRRVMKYSDNGELLLQFEGKTSDEVLHGFIIPSPYFDLDVNSFGELWVVNPGRHMFENFTLEGDFRTKWSRTSMRADGFSGCCNPSYFALMSDGSFVTSEKGIPRIKIHDQHGRFVTMVAPADRFHKDTVGLDLAVDSQDRVWVLYPKETKVLIFAKSKGS